MKNKTIIPLLAFKDNYIWTCLDATSKRAWVIDPGESAPVIEALMPSGFELAGILLTHHHHDHTGGVSELLQRWPHCLVYGSHRSAISQITHRVKEGDEVNCSPFQFKVLEIPGHTLDHIAFFNEDVVFSGDTLFSAGCGRVFEGTMPQMYDSLYKLMVLPDNLQLYCGHEYTVANLEFAQLVEPGNEAIKTKITEAQNLRAAHKPTLPSTMGQEKRFNPFLRCSAPSVIESAQQYVGKNLPNEVDVFEVLRTWKNSL